MRKYIFIIAIIGVTSFGIYKYFNLLNKTENVPQVYVPDAPNIKIEDRLPPKGRKEYQSRKYRFSLFFPDDLIMTQYSVSGNGQTTIFENKDGSKGVQVFVIPYNEDHVTEERFKMDLPSGIMKDQLDILVDGVNAKTFTSRDESLGETQEVWFIKNGFLYEVTTTKQDEKMLIELINSWKFY